MAYIVDQYFIFKITSRELQSADLTPYNIVYTVSVFSVVRRSHKKKTYFNDNRESSNPKFYILYSRMCGGSGWGSFEKNGGMVI